MLVEIIQLFLEQDDILLCVNRLIDQTYVVSDRLFVSADRLA